LISQTIMEKMLNMKNKSIKINLIIKCLPVDFKNINNGSNSN
jgi:hypothetical protein